jgi:branched-chain amino acid transport system substrate-binding protein
MVPTRRSRWSRTAAVACGALLLAALIVPAAGASVRRAPNVLGTKQPAKGTPVKIGFITEGKYATTDNTLETPVANAAVQWINQYRNGVGGHPVELDRCVANGVPSGSTDCANQMIADKVAAVVTGAMANFPNLWAPLHQAGIPIFVFAAGSTDALSDPSSTFVFSSGTTALNSLNIAIAKKTKGKKVTVVAIDVPAATQLFKDKGAAVYQQAGIPMELVPVAPGTADMTPQMQRVVSTNPDGVAFVIGNDTFCISAFNGLRIAGFKGTVTAVPQCFSDATRTAVPADFLAGMQITSTAPLDNPKDPSMKQYYAVLDKFGASSVDKSTIDAVDMFQSVAGLNIATQTLKGEPTPQSIIAAAKSMPWTVLPATGGLHARCSGKANPDQPAVCMTGALAATLDSQGKASKYTPVGDTQIAG